MLHIFFVYMKPNMPFSTAFVLTFETRHSSAIFGSKEALVTVDRLQGNKETESYTVLCSVMFVGGSN